MKRFLILANLALLAIAGTATVSYAGGAFGLFYCPKYCSSYCQAACPHNAFSCPAPGCCGAPAGGGGCCKGGAPHATSLVSSTPQHFDPVCGMCGMNSYGLGGVRGHGFHKSKCKGGKCGGGMEGGCYGGSCGAGYGVGFDYPMGPSVFPSSGPIVADQLAIAPGTNNQASNPAAQYWLASQSTQQMNNYNTQPVSYQGYQQGYNYPMNAYWGYGYGYYPTPAYNPAMWSPQGYQGAGY